MYEQKKKRRLWWLIAAVLLLLIAGAALLLYLAASRGVSADADDPAAILAGYDIDSFAGFSLREDGKTELRLEKADLYWFAGEYDLKEPVLRWLEGDDALLSAGFRLTGGRIAISISRRAGGMLPLSYRAWGDVALRDSQLYLQIHEVTLGSRISLRESWWPALFRQELVLDLRGTDLADGLLSAEISGGELRLTYAGLTQEREGTLRVDEESAAALRLFGMDNMSILPARDGTVEASALCESAVRSGKIIQYLAEEMSLCRAEDLPVLWEQSSSIERRWLWEAVRAQEETCRSQLQKTLAERQNSYEKLLLSVRELYRSGALGIRETGFYNSATQEAVHPGTLSKLPVTAIDSRIVFLTTDEYEAAPEEMPPLLSVPRKDWFWMEYDVDWWADVDLGVMLTTEGEVPILLYRRANGTLVLREVTEELYVSAMVNRPIPKIDLDALAPITEYSRPAREGFPRAVIGYLQ